MIDCVFLDAISPSTCQTTTVATLPNTPKSAGDVIASLGGGGLESEAGRLQQQQQQQHQINCHDSVVVQAQQHQKFVLAPTPAQLGRAPLQRRKNLGKPLRPFTPLIPHSSINP